MEKGLWREIAGNEDDTEQARERREQRFDGEGEEEVVGKEKQHQVLIDLRTKTLFLQANFGRLLLKKVVVDDVS